MKCVVLLPDGVGVRNFLLGGFAERQAAEGEVHVLHQIPPAVLPRYQTELNGTVRWHEFSSYQETPVSFVLRYALMYAQMHWVNTKSMRYRMRSPMKGSWRTRAGDRAARALGKAAAFPRGIQTLSRWHVAAVGRRPDVKKWRAFFEEVQPSVVFCSHQRPPTILPVILAARECGIPTATFIFSWDNLTSKGRIAAPFDHFLVWSDLMRTELLRYYPDVRPEQVHVVGTPQFDPYADPSLRWSREEFFARIGGDPARRLICYSGNNLQNGPEDPEHVRTLMTFIRSGRIRGNPQVVVRPAPVDDGSRYAAVRREFPELLFQQPAWENPFKGGWDHVLPLPEDVPFLANLIHHSDLNINFGSTMTLDFAVHDKPVVNAAFDLSTPPPFGIPSYEFLMQFEHYRPVLELGSSRFARTPDELADHVNHYLENPAIDREGRRKLVDLQVSGPLGSSTPRIIDVLASISRTAPARNGRSAH